MRMSAGAAVAALAVLAAGCGGGGGGERLGRETYITKADAICRDVAQKRNALPVPGSIKEIPRYVDRALPLFDAARSDLGDLRPPNQLDAPVASWLAVLNEEHDALSDLRSAAKDGSEQKVRAVGS